MRIWKIIDSATHDKGMQLYADIQAATEHNKKVWQTIVPFKWESYYANEGGFNLPDSVYGVIPEDKDAELPKGWKWSKDRGVVPDGRYKEGKKAAEYIQTSEIQIGYTTIFKKLLITDPHFSRFKIPRLYPSKDGTEIYVCLDDKIELEEDTRFEEVTISYVNSKLRGT